MSSRNNPVVCVIPGDLHLTEAGRDNHRTALWMVDEVNRLIRPDFVQFIGDNVQDAATEQFQLFRALCDRLQVPWFALVGDHDVHGDADVRGFCEYVGEPYGALRLRGFRFLRLNTMEHRPLGLSPRQLHWFRGEVDEALTAGERVVEFQHHYPFKVYETFAGPGLDVWREVVQTRRITAIFTGHTHYGQMANDGRNVVITTRSIGDPEGGPAGYRMVYLHGDDLAVTYRSVDDRGPLVLITHPRERLLATAPPHVVSEADCCRVRIWSEHALRQVRGCLDDGDTFLLDQQSDSLWSYLLAVRQLAKGNHVLEVQAIDARGQTGGQRLEFVVDRTGRYTAVPGVRPYVAGTAFC